MTKENEKKKDEKTAKSTEKPKEDVKIFKARAMVDADVRMPKPLRDRLKFLKPHIEVIFEVIEETPNTITLRLSRGK